MRLRVKNHTMTVLYPNLCYKEVCYKETALYYLAMLFPNRLYME